MPEREGVSKNKLAGAGTVANSEVAPPFALALRRARKEGTPGNLLWVGGPKKLHDQTDQRSERQHRQHGPGQDLGVILHCWR
jgi:hypothetical protein